MTYARTRLERALYTDIDPACCEVRVVALIARAFVESMRSEAA